MNLQVLAVSLLAMTAVGGVAWVFLYPILSGERTAEKRRESVARAEPAARAVRGAQKSRREQVEESLKELEKRQQRQKRPPLSVRIAQAGLNWSKRQFILISAGAGIVSFVLVLGSGLGLMAALGFGFAAGFGLPFWLLGYLKKRREAKFLNAFPDAVDVIVRGIKSGLPLLDSLRVIATEAEEPVRSEFRGIIETQTVGIPLGDACQRLYERMPLPEANFFGIVVAIQQKSGGNLAEALGNLSKVLRDRKKMKAKIQAMSMEAKASAAIIGSLPPAVMILVWLSSPDYISLLWTHPTGHMLLAGSALWMFTGCMVMRKMINFDF
jgi:tight adherence protein B